MPKLIYLLLIYLVVFITVAIFSNFMFGIGRIFYRYFQGMYMESLNKNLENMFIFMNPTRILNISLMIMSLLFLTTLMATDFNFTFALGTALVGLLLPRILILRYMGKRRKQFETQLVQGLEFLSTSMKAGLSLIQALESLVENSVPPLSQEFDLVLREYRIGVPMNEAMQNLARRIESEEINLMVFSTIITRELGGDISEVFENLADIIRKRQQVMERIETLTAQGKLQAMICGFIPFLLYGFIWVWKPEFIQTLLSSALGRYALIIVGILQLVVMISVRRMVDIRV